MRSVGITICCAMLMISASERSVWAQDLQAVTDAGAETTDAITVDSDGDEITVIGGKLGIGMTNPSEAVELAQNSRIKLSTDLTNLTDSALVKLKWADPDGKPAVVWFDTSDRKQAAVVAHDYLSYPDNQHKHLSFETSDSAGSLQTRLEIPWGGDRVEIMTHNADFKVAGGYKFTVGASSQSGTAVLNSNTYVTGTRKLGVGFTSADQPFYTSPSGVSSCMEVYRNGSNTELLIHEDAGTKEARLHLRRGEMDWEIINNDNMTVEAEDKELFRITKTGKVGIGQPAPIHPLQLASGAHVTAGGVWTNASSRALKENIRQLNAKDALTALAKLHPVRFNYKSEKGEEYLGFIAEDVPDLVATKDRRSLSPMDVVALLTEVVQTQQQKIEELQARLDSM